MTVDPSGEWFETLLDIVSVVKSFVNFVRNPTWGTGLTLAYDCAAAVAPGLPGSYVTKAANKVSNTVKYAKKASSSGGAKVSKGAGNAVKWNSAKVSNAAKQLENGATSVTVKSSSEAEELFLGIYQGKGYKNVTGMDAKNLLGTKANTYHWDDIIGADGRVVGHSPTNADGAMPHLQIHPERGKVIRIFFEP